MNKILCLIEDHPEIAKLEKRIHTIKKHVEERYQFIQKQMDVICEKANAERKTIWLEIGNILKEKGKIPKDLDPKDFVLSLDGGAVHFIEAKGIAKNESSFLSFLKGMISEET